MSKHMIIWYEGELDSIEVFLNEPTVVVTAKRSDLETLKTLEEARNAGVYVLINGSNMRYVGQASGSVYSRLNTHDKNKLWWDTVIFFGRVDGQLDKSQLDYLENKLIRLFEEKGFTMDNQTAGNQSFIAPYQRGKAESLLSDAVSILEHATKLNIFKLARVRKRAASNTSDSLLDAVNASSTNIDRNLFNSGTPEINAVNLIEVFLVRGELKATGIWDSGTNKLTVLKGSKIRVGEKVNPGQTSSTISNRSVSAYKKYDELREDLFSSKVIDWVDGEVVFLKEHIFSTPSSAASVIVGGSSNGKFDWKLENGMSIGAYEGDTTHLSFWKKNQDSSLIKKSSKVLKLLKPSDP